MNLDYFFDSQLRRVIKHLLATFGNFKVYTGLDDLGEMTFKKVPCLWGDPSRQVGGVIRSDNNENTLTQLPFMALDIESHTISRENIRGQITQDIRIATNKQNQDGEYINELDKIFHVSRFQPVPWSLDFKIDIFTSNTTNKTELIQQIALCFYPSIQLQMTTNSLDWTGLVDVELASCDWTSRSRPSGTEDQVDVCTLHFKSVMWYAPPAKVREAKQIHEVITTITDSVDPFEQTFDKNVIVTPNNHLIKVNQDNDEWFATLLTSSGSETTPSGDFLSWDKLFELYGEFQEGISQMRLKRTYDDENPIVATMSYPLSGEENTIQLDIDENSLPTSTLDPVIGFIDPTKHFPNGNGAVLPSPTGNDRYVCLGEANLDTVAWNNETIVGSDNIVNTNDIVEYNQTSSKWEIIFKASESTNVEYLDNINDGKKYQFTKEEGWFDVIYSIYRQGMWKIILMEE